MSGLPAEGPWVPGMTAHTVPAVKNQKESVFFLIPSERKSEVIPKYYHTSGAEIQEIETVNY